MLLHFTQKLLRKEAFTHRGFYTQTPLHTDAFTHRRFYTQTLLHRDPFTHTSFYTQKLLHTETFTHRSFYTQTLSHTEAFTHKHFHTNTFTHRDRTREIAMLLQFSTSNGPISCERVAMGQVKSQVLPQFFMFNRPFRAKESPDGLTQNRNFTSVFDVQTSISCERVAMDTSKSQFYISF